MLDVPEGGSEVKDVKLMVRGSALYQDLIEVDQNGNQIDETKDFEGMVEGYDIDDENEIWVLLKFLVQFEREDSKVSKEQKELKTLLDLTA